MPVPTEEQLELDLQQLADYQRFKRLGSSPEFVFVVNALGGGTSTGGTSGGGDASAANQVTEITRLTTIRDRLPGTLTAGGALRTDSSGVTQPVSGTLNIGNFPATQQVAGSLSISNFPLTQNVSVGNFPATQQVVGSLSVSNFPATQAVSAVSLPLPVNAATNASVEAVSLRLGAVNEPAAASPTASSGLAGLIRFFFTLFPVALSADGRFKTESNIRKLTLADDRVSAVTEPSKGILIDRSGALMAANTAQELMPANSARKYLLIQNNSASDLWINFGDFNASAGQPSFKLLPNGDFGMELSFVSTERVTVFGTTIGQAYTAKEA